MSYYGRGPFEAYADRKHAARVGRYQLAIDSLNERYIKPAEHGNRMRVEDLAILTNSGDTLSVYGGYDNFNFSIWPYDQQTLEDAQHTNELTPSENLTLNLDHGQIGVGGDNSWMWSAAPFKEHRMEWDRVYRYGFTLRLGGFE